MISAIGGNPMAKARAATALSEDAQREMSNLQSETENEAVGSPRRSLLISLMTKAATLTSLAKLFFEEAIKWLLSDQQSTKATHSLANAAK